MVDRTALIAAVETVAACGLIMDNERSGVKPFYSKNTRYFRGFRSMWSLNGRSLKNAICRVGLHAVCLCVPRRQASFRRTVRTPHSPGFATPSAWLASHRFTTACPPWRVSRGRHSRLSVTGSTGRDLRVSGRVPGCRKRGDVVCRNI